jgi:hypothetical protein
MLNPYTIGRILICIKRRFSSLLTGDEPRLHDQDHFPEEAKAFGDRL